MNIWLYVGIVIVFSLVSFALGFWIGWQVSDAPVVEDYEDGSPYEADAIKLASELKSHQQPLSKAVKDNQFPPKTGG